MQYDEFRSKVKNYPVISGNLLKVLAAKAPGLKTNLQRWQKKGKVIRLRRDSYVLNPEDSSIQPSRMFLALEIYRPSYISMEYALSAYGLIPERTTAVTSISTKKTRSFKNKFGSFIYQHIKPQAFTGFKQEKDEAELPYFMAVPEKALVDFIYLRRNQIKDDYKQFLLESYRLQNLETIDFNKVLSYGSLFQNTKLDLIIKKLMEK